MYLAVVLQVNAVGGVLGGDVVLERVCLLLQKMCSDEWRPSRVESECITGDGVTFYYPDVDCSPFLAHSTGIRHIHRHSHSHNPCIQLEECALRPGPLRGSSSPFVGL